MRQPWWVYFLFLFLPVLSCGGGTPSVGQETALEAVSIIDGDTFTGRGGGQTLRIRLHGIDAPERGQDFSRKSRERLGELCRRSPLRVRMVNRDGFGRWVADVYDNEGRHVNAEMVASGLAWHFRRYSNDPVLERLEVEARAARRGLWAAPDPQAPWAYRAARRSMR